MGLLTERYFGYDIPGWAYAEDLDDYFMTIDEGRAAPLVLAMTNDPELTRFGPQTCATRLHPCLSSPLIIWVYLDPN